MFSVPGATFVMRVDAVTWVRPVWLLQLGELTLRVGARPVRMGSGGDDTVWLDGLPPGAVEICLAERGLTAQFRVPVVVDGKPFEASQVVELHANSLVEVGDHAVRVLSDAEGPAATIGGSLSPPVARKVAFSFLPVGGRLDLSFDHGNYTAELSELRARLVVALLSPRGDYEAGDFVADEVLIPSVWPGERSRGRLDVNTLVHRLRRSLLSAGIDPTTVVERARSGGATRFCVGEKTTISID